MSGFHAHLTDVFGTVSIDYYGNALCTSYQHDAKGAIAFDAANKPVVDTTQGPRSASATPTGVIKIPNIGPNRYAATVTPPRLAGAQWVQTTTLEGGHDHDIWSPGGRHRLRHRAAARPGARSRDAVRVRQVRRPWLRPPRTPADTVSIKGVVVQGLPYIGGQNGQVGPRGRRGREGGARLANVWVALSDLNHGDQQVYVGRGRATAPSTSRTSPTAATR